MPSLSTRVGRRWSRSKLIVHRLLSRYPSRRRGRHTAALTETVAIDVADLPLSSTTLQVTVMVVPPDTPEVDKVAVLVVTAKQLPAEAL